MGAGTLVLVHGTGVRLHRYVPEFDLAAARASACGVTVPLLDCVWGDALGVQFDGKSLPDPPTPAQLADEAEDFARWHWLFDDPLFELDRLGIRDGTVAAAPPNPRIEPPWRTLWNTIAAYQPTVDLRALLDRGGLAEFWEPAWSAVAGHPIARRAFEASSSELPEAAEALARAVIAQLHTEAVARGASGPGRQLRQSLLDRLMLDWHQKVYGPGTFLWSLVARAATKALRRHRNELSDAVALPIGDILLYQARGHAIRDFIAGKVAAAEPPVTLVAHSLGGIACVDLLALPGAPRVDGLVTVGSQAPLLYELGALPSLKPPAQLPGTFPRWLNIYDRNDFLSYVAGRLFEGVVDREVASGLPFPASHSAYFGDDDVWHAIAEFQRP